MPPWNVTLCPVTSHTLTSILQTRDDPLTEAPGGDEQPAGTRPEKQGLTPRWVVLPELRRQKEEPWSASSERHTLQRRIMYGIPNLRNYTDPVR